MKPSTTLAQVAALKADAAARQALITTIYHKINRSNPALNAITYLRPLAAVLKEAADPRWQTTAMGGMPLLIKGLGQAAAGFPAAEGSRLLARAHYHADDNFVARLRQRGFIIIGQTNVPEFGFQNTTNSPQFGAARNPHNLLYSPGGSSGGSAAAIAAGIVPFATASDGGGSIRIPASWCGLVGLKPTRGRTLVGPSSWRGWQGAAINFALSKTVSDCALLLEQMQGYQAGAPFNVPLLSGNLSEQSRVPATPTRVAVCTTSPVKTPVSTTAKAAVAKLAAFLDDHGFLVERASPNIDSDQLIQDYYVVNAVETAAMFASINAQRTTPVQPSEVEPLTWALAQAGKHFPAAAYSQALSRWDQASATMTAFSARYPLYLTPTTATTAPKISEPAAGPAAVAALLACRTATDYHRPLAAVSDFFAPALARTPFTQLANITGQPAISLPLAVGAANLPLGVQLQAAKGAEMLLLKVSAQVEAAGLFRQ